MGRFRNGSGDGKTGHDLRMFLQIQITNRVRGGIGTDFDRKYNIVCVLLRTRTKMYIIFLVFKKA